MAKIYVYAHDRIWKDWVCCECKDWDEAEMVFNKWSSFKDRTRVEMSEKEYPRKSSGVRYKVTDDGSIVLKRPIAV
jgi:hypothetical protein